MSVQHRDGCHCIECDFEQAGPPVPSHPPTPTNVIAITHARKKKEQVRTCGDGCPWPVPKEFAGTIAHPITFACPYCGIEYTIDANV